MRTMVTGIVTALLLAGFVLWTLLCYLAWSSQSEEMSAALSGQVLETARLGLNQSMLMLWGITSIVTLLFVIAINIVFADLAPIAQRRA